MWATMPMVRIDAWGRAMGIPGAGRPEIIPAPGRVVHPTDQAADGQPANTSSRPAARPSDAARVESSARAFAPASLRSSVHSFT